MTLQMIPCGLLFAQVSLLCVTTASGPESDFNSPGSGPALALVTAQGQDPQTRGWVVGYGGWGLAVLARVRGGGLSGCQVSLDGGARCGIRSSAPSPGSRVLGSRFPSWSSSWQVFMACPFPFSKSKMIMAVSSSLPTPGRGGLLPLRG